MDRRQAIALGMIGAWQAARAAQNSGRGEEAVRSPADSPEPLAVSAEHPRLLLNRQRLRLLRRERERTSGRWQQFELLMQGKAPMPERGLAQALYYQVAGDQAAGRQAIAWALGASADFRQQAIVYDWCHDIMTRQQSSALAARLEKGIAEKAADKTVGGVRSLALAGIALYDHVPQSPQHALDAVRAWWDQRLAPALKRGKDVLSREDAYPLFEMLHAVRDTTNVDLREVYPLFFKEYPIEHLLSHYPASYPAAENEYRIGASPKIGEPDLRAAALSRAAEMAMVAYDVNAPSSQVLQGWLMHDRFVLRGPFGIVYEFLWANPYQPGLSYYHVPLVYHNPDFGKLFIRSNWDDSATWFGYFGGVAQLFSEGRVTQVNPQLEGAPLALTEAIVILGGNARRFQTRIEEEEAVFAVGLRPRQSYLVEVDHEEAFEAATDPGGILMLDLPRGVEVGVRMREIDVPVRPRDRRREPMDRPRTPRTPPRIEGQN